MASCGGYLQVAFRSTSPIRISSLSCDAFRDDPPKRIAEETSRPKTLDPRRWAYCREYFRSRDPRDSLRPHTRHWQLHVRAGLSARHHAARLQTQLSPPDASRLPWDKKNVRTLQSRQPRAFGIPLVPADKSSHTASIRCQPLETEIARSEIKLFVVKRIVRDVHLAVKACWAAIGVKVTAVL